MHNTVQPTTSQQNTAQLDVNGIYLLVFQYRWSVMNVAIQCLVSLFSVQNAARGSLGPMAQHPKSLPLKEPLRHRPTLASMSLSRITKPRSHTVILPIPVSWRASCNA